MQYNFNKWSKNSKNNLKNKKKNDNNDSYIDLYVIEHILS